MIDSIIVENIRRNSLLNTPYDPIAGIGAAGERVEMLSPGGSLEHIPATMAADPQFAVVRGSDLAWRRLRVRHDFEYWAATCVTIRDKLTGCDVKLRLNRPQRRVLAILEKMRLQSKPIRLIMLKARQWGGSLTYIYSCTCYGLISIVLAHNLYV